MKYAVELFDAAGRLDHNDEVRSLDDLVQLAQGRTIKIVGLTSGAETPALTFPYTNWRGEFSVRRVLPIRVWFGSTDWHPEPQWLLRALDLDKGGERDFAFSQINKPEPVTEEDGAIGWCEGCSKAIREGERHHTGAEVLLCEACAPSYSDMLSSPELFRNSEDEPMT
jgi:hypothetical protein